MVNAICNKVFQSSNFFESEWLLTDKIGQNYEQKPSLTFSLFHPSFSWPKLFYALGVLIEIYITHS